MLALDTVEFTIEELIDRCLRDFDYNPWIAGGDWNKVHPDAAKDLFSEIRSRLNDREVLYSLPNLSDAFNFALMEKATGKRIRPGDKILIKDLVLTDTKKYSSVNGIVVGCAGQFPWWEKYEGAGDWKLRVQLITKKGELSKQYSDVIVALSKCALVPKLEVGGIYYRGEKRVKILELFSETATVIESGGVEKIKVQLAELTAEPPQPEQLKGEQLSLFHESDTSDLKSELQKGDTVQLQDGRVGEVLGITRDVAAVEVPSDDPEYEFERPLVPVVELKKVEAGSASSESSNQNYTPDSQTPALFAPYVTEEPQVIDVESVVVCDEPPRELEPHPNSLRIELTEIRRDGGTQPRAAINLHHVRLLEQQIMDGVELEPVVVFYDGTDYWLADGFHRWQAHHNLDKLDINCTIHQGTRRDAVLYSCGANADHKPVLARSRDDKKRAVMMLLNDSEWGQWSNREIARRCKVDDKTVAYWRNKQNPQNLTADIRSEEGNEENPPTETQTRTFKTKHGTVSRMKTDNIGKKTVPESEPLANTELLNSEELKTQTVIETSIDDIAIAFLSNSHRLRDDHLTAVGRRFAETLTEAQKQLLIDAIKGEV